MTESDSNLAVVTGGNRGIGLEVCRQLAEKGNRVILTARRRDAGEEAADGLARRGLEVGFRQLDVADPGSVAEFAARMADGGARIGMLVNNAGVSLKGFNAEVVKQTMAVNFHGAMQLTDAVASLMAGAGRIVMVSSGLGALSCLSPERRGEFLAPGLTREGLSALVEEFRGAVARGNHRARGWPNSAYSVSKVALNALTRILAGELEGTEKAVNAVCPGWVRTGMGGKFAPRGVKKGAHTIVWAATLPAGGPSGAFLRDRKEIPW